MLTYKAIRRCGYTGPVRIVIDSEDKQAELYWEIFGKDVRVFNKDVIEKTFDIGDNFPNRASVIYARNAVWDIARKDGFRYYLELDDDYGDFWYMFDKDLNFGHYRIKNLDEVCEAMLCYLDQTKASTVAMAQGGEFIGGGASKLATELKPKRKAMNTFFCDTERPFQFVGKMNDDVNTYVTLGSRGKLFLQIPNIAIYHSPTQQMKGGMTDTYLDTGTFVKSFYSVMYAPTAVKVTVLNTENARLHHNVKWNNAVPKILHEKFKHQ